MMERTEGLKKSLANIASNLEEKQKQVPNKAIGQLIKCINSGARVVGSAITGTGLAEAKKQFAQDKAEFSIGSKEIKANLGKFTKNVNESRSIISAAQKKSR